MTKAVSFCPAVAFQQARRQPMALRDLIRMQDEEFAEDDVEATPRRNYFEMLRREAQEIFPTPAKRKCVSREEADVVLLEAILNGDLKELEEALQRHRGHASERVVQRVIGLVCQKKREENCLQLEQGKEMTPSIVGRQPVFVSLKKADISRKFERVDSDVDVPLPEMSHRQGKSTNFQIVHPARSVVRMGQKRVAFRLEEIPLQGTGTNHSGTEESGEAVPCIDSRSTEDDKVQPFVSPVGREVDDRSFRSLHERPCQMHQNSNTRAPSDVRIASPGDRGLFHALLTEAREQQGWRTSLVEVLNPCSSDRIGLNLAPQSKLAQQARLNPVESNAAVESVASSTSTSTDSLLPTPQVSLMTLLHQEGDPENVFVLNSQIVEAFKIWDGIEVDGGMDPICCVCMVAKKGAAFIPCGHTFCLKCTRKLRKERRTCPLCNRTIQDVLKIF